MDRVASEHIKVLVGDTEHVFLVPKPLLESSSGFFKNALKEDWKESSERTVKLLEANPKYFTIYVKWLYSGRIYCDNGTRSGLWDELGRVFALGDFVQDLDFKDAIIDTFIEAMRKYSYFPVYLGQSIYPFSRKGSAHRRFATDVAVNIFRRDVERNGFEVLQHPDTPLEFLQDILLTLNPMLLAGVPRTRAAQFFSSKGPCNYHDHGSDKPCYKERYHL
jgi:hypothetical protein